MSSATPAPFNVVYDTDNGLRYEFATGYITIPAIANAIDALTGDVSATGPGTATATISAATVTGKLLTGYVSGAGTVAATDTILQGINKLNGNAAAISTVANAALPSASFTDAAVTSKLLTGYVSGSGTVASTDTILQGINKLNGNDALAFLLEGGTQRGTVFFQKAPSLAATSITGTGTITADATLGTTFFTTVTGALTLN